MDRFLLYVRVDYPNAEHEGAILRLVRGENAGTAKAEPMEPLKQADIFEARELVNQVKVAEAAEQYLVDLVIATREPERFGEDLARWIDTGVSPRATIALDAAARALAWIRGRDFVSPEDIQAVAPACLAHRIHLSYEAEAAGKSRDDVIQMILEQVAVTA